MWRFWIWRHGLAIYSAQPRLVHHGEEEASTISGTETRVTKRPGLGTIARGILLRLSLYPLAWLRALSIRWRLGRVAAPREAPF